MMRFREEPKTCFQLQILGYKHKNTKEEHKNTSKVHVYDSLKITIPVMKTVFYTQNNWVILDSY